MVTSQQPPQNREAAAPLLRAQGRWLCAGCRGRRAPFLGQTPPAFALTCTALARALQTQGSSLQEQDAALRWGLLLPRGRILHGPGLCPEQPQHRGVSAEGFWAALLQGSAVRVGVSVAPTSTGEQLRCKPVPVRL